MSITKNDFITSDRYLECINYLNNNLNISNIIYYKRDFLFRSGMWRNNFIPEYRGKHKIIVVGHSDEETNSYDFDRLKSNNDNLKMIFAINGNSIHENIIPLPLGITNDCDDSYIHKIFGNLDQMLEVMNKPRNIINNVYLNINIQTFVNERQYIYNIFINKKYIKYDPPTQTIEGRYNFLESMRNSKFVICPRGNGIDTHRLWEALYMGSIPIVIYTNVHKMLLDLPILFIKNWDEINEEFLEFKYNEISNKTWNMEKLNINYWINLIKTYL